MILLGVVGGGFYLWYTINKSSGDDDSKEGGSDNPIDMAKKIMDKYK